LELVSASAKARASRPPSSRTMAIFTTVVSSEMPKPNRNRKVSGSTTAMIQLDGSRVTCLPSLIMIARVAATSCAPG